MESSNKMIHVKAKLDEDFRRFQSPNDYETVLSTLRSLFQFPEQETFQIKFLDDEGDLCTISSQLEFSFAVAHSDLLKITLLRDKKPEVLALTPLKPALGCPALANPKMDCLKERLAAVNAKLALTNLPPHKVENLNRRKKFLEAKLSQTAQNPDAEVPAWKLGCGIENRLAGINAKLEQPELPPHKKESLLKKKQWLEAKLEKQRNGEIPMKHGRGAHLENRLAWINAKLAQPDLPQEKVEKLTKRKEFLEAQINNPQATDAFPHPHDMSHPRGRCGGFGKHNLENRLAWIRAKLEKPDLPPHKVEKLTHHLEMLEAKLEARKNGVADAEEKPQCKWAHPCGRLEARIAMLDAKLQQTDLSDEKKETLMAKKAWMEEKLEARKAWSNGTAEMPPHGMPHPHHGPDHEGMPPHHPHPHHGFPHHGPHGHPHGHGPHPHPHGFGHRHHGGHGPHPHHGHGPHHAGHHGHGFGHPHHGPHHGGPHAPGPHYAQHRGGFCRK